MKSNLQGRGDDRKGGFSPPPNTAKLPAGAAVRWSYPRTEFVNCKTDETDAIVIDYRIGRSSEERGPSMRGVAFLLGLTAAVTSLPGCLVISETRRDQDKIRTTLNTLYEDQIIDNLIRAANGLPFVQIDYTNATTTITVTESGNVGGTQTTGPNATNIVGSALRFAHQFANIWTYGLSGQNSNQIALTANPVINSNEVYDAYLQFLANPGSLIVSCDPPPEGKAHMCRKWQGKYYWVPIEYRYLFLKLALVTTSQRGKRLQPVDDFFPVQVNNVLFEEQGDRNVTFLTVKLDGPIPSDNGRIEFTIDSKRVQFGVDQPPAPLGSPPETNDVIRIQFNPQAGAGAITSVGDFKARLPLSGKLFLRNSHPQPPSTSNLLDSVRFQLEQIRLNQVRLQ